MAAPTESPTASSRWPQVHWLCSTMVKVDLHPPFHLFSSGFLICLPREGPESQRGRWGAGGGRQRVLKALVTSPKTSPPHSLPNTQHPTNVKKPGDRGPWLPGPLCKAEAVGSPLKAGFS